MRTRTVAVGGTLVAALLLAGCPKPKAPAPSAGTPAAGTPVAQTPTPHLAGAPPGKAQTRVREVMDRVQAENQLHQIGILLKGYETDFNRYPTRLDDFLEYIKRDAPREYESLKTGYFVMTLDPRPTSEKGIVYEKDPDLSGMHLVLMGDCNSVQRLNEQEFKAAVPSAGK